jgi:hypothetical protein
MLLLIADIYRQKDTEQTWQRENVHGVKCGGKEVNTNF